MTEQEKIEFEMIIREKVAEERRAAKRAWRQKNPDKVKKHNEAYYLKKAKMIMAKSEEGQHD